MCGIAGYIMRDGARPDPRELGHIIDALAHRGPDDHGIHTSGPVGLAQVRLSIIGLATGHQFIPPVPIRFPWKRWGETAIFHAKSYTTWDEEEDFMLNLGKIVSSCPF